MNFLRRVAIKREKKNLVSCTDFGHKALPEARRYRNAFFCSLGDLFDVSVHRFPTDRVSFRVKPRESDWTKVRNAGNLTAVGRSASEVRLLRVDAILLEAKNIQ